MMDTIANHTADTRPQRRHETPSEDHGARTALARLAEDVDAALHACWRQPRRNRRRLLSELELVNRCQHAALLWPSAYRELVDGRERSLALWLFGLAVSVAATGLRDDAGVLLDALPEVDGRGDGREALLDELLALAGNDRGDGPAHAPATTATTATTTADAAA